MRDVVALEGIENFAAEIEDGNQYKGEGYFILAVVGKGREQYHHENDAGGAEKRMGKKTGVEDSCHETGNDYHQKHGERAVRFFQYRSKEKDVSHVAEQVVPVGMARDMGKKAEIVDWFGKVESLRVRNGKEGPGKPVQVKLVEGEHERAEKSEGQCRRRIIFYFHSIVILTGQWSDPVTEESIVEDVTLGMKRGFTQV